jgi:hypothetical protein
MARVALSGILAASLLPLAGCGAANAPDPVAMLAPLVAHQRQCAPLVAGAWPIDLAADRLQAPGIDALVAAGILTRQRVISDPDARPRFDIGIAPGGRDWVELRQLNAGGGKTPFLCYGMRQLVDVGASTGDMMPYRFRVVDPAPWIARADVQAAYPFLRTALAGPIVATVPAIRRNGAWQLPENANWQSGEGLDKMGFYPCLSGDHERPCG